MNNLKFLLIAVVILCFCMSCGNDESGDKSYVIEKRKEIALQAIHDFESRAGITYTEEDIAGMLKDISDSLHCYYHLSHTRKIPDSLRVSPDDSMEFIYFIYEIDTSGLKIYTSEDTVDTGFRIRPGRRPDSEQPEQ